MKTITQVSILALTLFFVGCGGDSTAPAPAAPSATTEPAAPADNGADEALIAEGKTLFESTAICFTCHGPDAKGTALAPDLTDAEWLNIEAPADLEKITAIIKTGVTEPKSFPAPMPGMANLTDDQVTAVAAYVLSLGS